MESSLLDLPDIYCNSSPWDKNDMRDEALLELDARGLDCPMPLLKAKRALNGMDAGQKLRVQATDGGSVRDFEVFARQSGHRLLSSDESEGVFTYLLEKA